MFPAFWQVRKTSDIILWALEIYRRPTRKSEESGMRYIQHFEDRRSYDVALQNFLKELSEVTNERHTSLSKMFPTTVDKTACLKTHLT